jgi:predicted  nucleic acid-binding Zn-ribbon protein
MTTKNGACIMKDEIDNFRTIVNALKDVPQDVTDIKRELLGSEYTQGKGLIHEVSDNKQEITKLRERYNTDRAWILGAAAVITIGFSIAFKLIFG